MPNDDGNMIFMAARIDGNQVFSKRLPIPTDYDAGRAMINSVGGDLMAAVLAYHANKEIIRLRKELEELKKAQVKAPTAEGATEATTEAAPEKPKRKPRKPRESRPIQTIADGV